MGILGEIEKKYQKNILKLSVLLYEGVNILIVRNSKTWCK
jgi:hypothetical protein